MRLGAGLSAWTLSSAPSRSGWACGSQREEEGASRGFPPSCVPPAGGMAGGIPALPVSSARNWIHEGPSGCVFQACAVTECLPQALGTAVTSDPPLIHFKCKCRSTVCPPGPTIRAGPAGAASFRKQLARSAGDLLGAQRTGAKWMVAGEGVQVSSVWKNPTPAP